MFGKTKRKKKVLDEVVRAMALPATELIVDVANTDRLELLSSHFGGAPYAESGDAWPTWGPEQRPYDFVCQINLGECPNKPAVSFDILQVFLCWKAVESLDFDNSCLIRSYHAPSSSRAVELCRPVPLDEEDYQVSACGMRTEPVLTYPWSLEKHSEALHAASQLRDPTAYDKSLKRLGYRRRDFSRVGGFPTWVHDNTLDDDDMIFIAQIEYEPPANNCIGDATPIFIAVPASEPTAFETDIWQSH